MTELLSVIMPVYNAGEYIEKCIESVLSQTYSNIELIIVDDGSTDDSGIICDSYAMRDKRVQVIHQENQGVMKTRLTGVRKSRGNYVTFIDADDWIREEMYQDLMSLMQTWDVDVVLSGAYRYFSEEKIIESKQTLREGVYSKCDIDREVLPYMLWDDAVQGWKVDPGLGFKIFKRNLILNSLQRSCKIKVHYGDDTSVTFPLLLEINSMYVTHKSYYYHRQRLEDQAAPYFKDDAYFDKLYSVYCFLKNIFAKYDTADILHRQLEMFYMHSIQFRKNAYQDVKEFRSPVFPYWEIERGSKVVVYGAGLYGRSYVLQNEQFEFCKIVAWVDKNAKKLREQILIIEDIDIIKQREFDYIVIAVDSLGLAKKIKEELQKMGVKEKQIIWSSNTIQKLR